MQFQDVTSCLLCGSNNKKQLIKKARFNARLSNVLCLNCGFVYQSPRLTDAFFNDYYKNFDFFKKNNANIEETFKSMSKLSKGRIDYLKKNNVLADVCSVLEIGSGSGAMLYALKELGKAVKGVEIDQNACEFSSNQLNLDVIRADFNQIKFEHKYDLFVLIHVLEHISNPDTFFKKLLTLINDHSLVYIEVPDIERPFTDESNFYNWFDLGHIYSFSKNSLRRFLAKYGLEVVNIERRALLGKFYNISCIAKKATYPNHQIGVKQNVNCDNPSEIEKKVIRARFLHPLYYLRYHYRGLIKKIICALRILK